MALFFLSYRRAQSSGHAGRLADALEARFGADAVFRDVDDIAPGEAFERVIAEHLQRVQAVLVMIGPGWLEAEEAGVRRLDREDDFVRREIAVALDSGKLLVPVLVGGAKMPAQADLPHGIRALAGRHAIELHEASWNDDVDRLTAMFSRTSGPDRAGRLATSGIRRGLWVRGVFPVLALAIGSLLWYPQQDPDAEIAARIAGKWTAEVIYPWGVSQTEQFDLLVQGSALSGSAGFLGVARQIQAGRVVNGQLAFETRSQASMGDNPPVVLTHRYMGTLEDERIRFVLHSGSPATGDSRSEFVAIRP